MKWKERERWGAYYHPVTLFRVHLHFENPASFHYLRKISLSISLWSRWTISKIKVISQLIILVNHVVTSFKKKQLVIIEAWMRSRLVMNEVILCRLQSSGWAFLYVCVCVAVCSWLCCAVWAEEKCIWGQKPHSFIVFAPVCLCVCGGGWRTIIPSSPAGIKQLFCCCLICTMPDFIDLLDWAAGMVDHSWVDVSLSSFPTVLRIMVPYAVDRSTQDLVLVACSRQSGWSSTSAPLFPWLVASCLYLLNPKVWGAEASQSFRNAWFPHLWCVLFWTAAAGTLVCLGSESEVFEDDQTYSVTTLSCTACPHFSSVALFFCQYVSVRLRVFCLQPPPPPLRVCSNTMHKFRSNFTPHYLNLEYGRDPSPAPHPTRLPTCLSAAKQKSDSGFPDALSTSGFFNHV